jgi:hypothetical protein
LLFGFLCGQYFLVINSGHLESPQNCRPGMQGVVWQAIAIAIARVTLFVSKKIKTNSFSTRKTGHFLQLYW